MGTTKVDLRIDESLLETVRKIALSRFNAKIHHISHKPEVTETINQLIRYGIEYLDKGYQDNDRVNPIVYPDNVITKEALDIAIAEVETKFKNQLGDFRSEVADTAITDGTMRSAIAVLLTKAEFESAKDDIWSELTRLDSSVAMVGNYYAFTGNEEFFNEQEKDTSENAPVTLQIDNQDVSPIKETKQPEMMVNPLLDGFEVNQATECPFIVGRSYTQQELKTLFKTDYGSDIINWIEKKKGSKNPIAQKYSRFFTTKGVGKDKIYVFNGE